MDLYVIPDVLSVLAHSMKYSQTTRSKNNRETLHLLREKNTVGIYTQAKYL